jgi:site-specific DNA recombinase
VAGPRVRPAPSRETIRDLAAGQAAELAKADDRDETARKIADCDRKLAQYRAALDAGASPATVAGWIAETEAERASYQAIRRPVTHDRRMSEAEIKAIVDKLTDIARVLQEADPDDKSEVFRQLGLKLTYHPARQLVQAKVEPAQHWFFDSVRGGTRSPLVVLHHRFGDPSPVQANTARDGRARIRRQHAAAAPARRPVPACDLRKRRG